MTGALFDPGEHEIPEAWPAWDDERARTAIREIARETDGAFREDALWPEHPHDADWSPGVPMTSVFWGASSVAWAMLHLRERGAIGRLGRDYLSVFEQSYRAYMAKPDSEELAPGYLFGECGILSAWESAAPSAELRDRIFLAASSTLPRPELELMWAAPGAIMAARWLFDRTGELRWRSLIDEGVRRLLDTWKEGDSGLWLWVQDLYGTRGSYLGAVHGFAGNVFALLKVQDLLPAGTRELVLARAADTLIRSALVEGELANWLPRPTSPRDSILVQWCHGAPGMITAFGDYPAGHSLELDELLLKGGELTWRAGPLRKPFGLCHGAAGNGYAFLKLHRRTGDPKWLERARTFAMCALEQSERQLREHGRRRYALLTGDLGLACYLQSCIDVDHRFPMIDFV